MEKIAEKMFNAQVTTRKTGILFTHQPAKNGLKNGKNGSTPQKMIFQVARHTQELFSLFEPDEPKSA